MFRLFGKREVVERRVEVITRDPCDLTPTEWRTRIDLCATARQTLSGAELRLMLDVVRSGAFERFDAPNGATMEERAFQQAQWQGYKACLDVLASLAVPIPTGDLPEPTFDKPEPLTD